MNLKIEEHEEEIEEKLNDWITDIKNSELAAIDSEEDEAPNNYEKVIQKLEGDVRNHISVEQ